MQSTLVTLFRVRHWLRSTAASLRTAISQVCIFSLQLSTQWRLLNFKYSIYSHHSLCDRKNGSDDAPPLSISSGSQLSLVAHAPVADSLGCPVHGRYLVIGISRFKSRHTDSSQRLANIAQAVIPLAKMMHKSLLYDGREPCRMQVNGDKFIDTDQS